MKALSLEKKLSRIAGLMGKKNPNFGAAHDVVCGEIKKARKKKLYRRLYRLCLARGMWHASQIIRPFTGEPEKKANLEKLVRAAVSGNRHEDALLGASRLGADLCREDILDLWAHLVSDKPADDVIRQSLWLALNRGHRHFDSHLAALLVQIRGRRLHDVEEVSLGYALRAYAENPPWEEVS